MEIAIGGNGKLHNVLVPDSTAAGHRILGLTNLSRKYEK